MNIFATNIDPYVAGAEHLDKHVVKMPIEYSQLLATAHRVLDGIPSEFEHPRKGLIDYPYALQEEQGSTPILPLASHQNHPSAIWARECSANYEWLYNLYLAVGAEYTYRYGREHASMRHAKRLQYFPENIRHSKEMTPFTMAMPDEYKCDDPIIAYRKYISFGKRDDLHVWSHRETPFWFQNT